MRAGRRSRRARALVAAAALVLSAFGPASYADLSTASPAPPYVSGLGTDFFASSNKAWGNAKELTPDASSNPLNKPVGEWDPETVIWAKSCSKKAQTATFQRTLTLPGRPATSALFIAPVFPTGVSTPFKSYSVKLNGATIAKGPLSGPRYGASTVVLPASAMKSFKDGAKADNVVVVSVKRGALPAGVKRCNTSSADVYGVMFRLYGELAADLALVDQAPAPTFRKAALTTTQVVNLSLRNLGPSAAVPGGTWRATIVGGGEVLLLGDSPQPVPGTFPTGPPFDRCTVVVVSSSTTEIRCDLTAVPAGTEAFLSIGLVRTFPTLQFNEAMTFLSWYVAHPEDPRFSNNERRAEFTWCGTLSTKPECLALG